MQAKCIKVIMFRALLATFLDLKVIMTVLLILSTGGTSTLVPVCVSAGLSLETLCFLIIALLLHFGSLLPTGKLQGRETQLDQY